MIAHNRHPKAVLLTTLILAAMTSTVLALDDEADTAPKDLPDAKSVIENALKAMGGREQLESVESVRMVGKMTPSMGMGEMPLEISFSAPSKFLLKQTVPGMGEVTAGSDGTESWMHQPVNGYGLLNETESQRAREQAGLYRIVLAMSSDYDEIETIEQIEFHGQDCYKLRMRGKERDEQVAMFNVDDHRIAGVEVAENTPMGRMTVVTRFGDWKKFGDISMFTQMIVEQPQLSLTLDLEEIEFDAVDESVFELPDDVKTLVSERDAENGADTEDEEDQSTDES